MFSPGCVKNSVHERGEVYTPPRQTPHLGRHTPPRQTPTPPISDGHCSGRYASYWNAFLLILQLKKPLLFNVVSSTCANYIISDRICKTHSEMILKYRDVFVDIFFRHIELVALNSIQSR